MIMKGRNFWAYIIKWRRRHLSDNQFMLLISLLVGVFTASAGLLLKWLIESIEHLLTHGFNITEANWLYLVYPVVGILFTMLFIRYIVRDDIGHGVTKILFAIARKQSKIRLHNTWSSVAASAITIGFGGSVGSRPLLYLREAPLAVTLAAHSICPASR